MAEYSIGIDLGGTNLRAASIDRSGKMIRKIAGSTDLSAGREAVVADMVAAINDLRAERGADTLAGVGVGTPGVIIMEKGVITGSPHMPGFHHIPTRGEIERPPGA